MQLRNDLSVFISISKYLHIEIFILVIITNTNTSPMGDGRSQGARLASRILADLCCFYLIKRARM